MKTFQEDNPEIVKNIRKALKSFKSGKYDLKNMEVILYSIIDMYGRQQKREADNEAAYGAAKSILNTSMEIFSELDSFNHASAFSDYLVEKFQQT